MKYKGRIKMNFKKTLMLAVIFTASVWAQAIDWSAKTITITTAAQLREISVLVGSNQRNFENQTIVLANDIDLKGSATNQWVPIGWERNPFRGTFDGNNKVIRGIFINNTEDSQGLFGVVENGTIRNLGVVVNIRANNNVGGLVGRIGGCWRNNKYHILNCYAIGNVTGKDNVGGLIGQAGEIDITNCYASVNVIGTGERIGGLLGNFRGKIKITNSYATGNLTSKERYVGGLLGGTNTSSGDVDVVNCYATGNVTGECGVGGLIGHGSLNISNSYATGNVTGTGSSFLGTTGVGGLVGSFWGEITNSYAMGSVTGKLNVGGLVGRSYSGKITNSFASGNVRGDSIVGGLVGWNGSERSEVVNSFASGTITRRGQNVGGLVGQNSGTVSPTSVMRTAAQMRQQSTFITWDFDKIWRITPNRNNGFPHLRTILTPQERAAEQARIKAEEEARRKQQRIQDSIQAEQARIRAEQQRIQREEERRRQGWSDRISEPNLQRLVFKSPRENQSNVAFEVGKQVPLQQDFSYVIEDKRVSFRFRDPRTLGFFINDVLISSFDLRRGIIREITIVNNNPNLGFGVFDVWGGDF